MWPVRCGRSPHAAAINIPGADYAAITLLTQDGKITTPAASDGLVERVERLQKQTTLHGGPKIEGGPPAALAVE